MFATGYNGIVKKFYNQRVCQKKERLAIKSHNCWQYCHYKSARLSNSSQKRKFKYQTNLKQSSVQNVRQYSRMSSPIVLFLAVKRWTVKHLPFYCSWNCFFTISWKTPLCQRVAFIWAFWNNVIARLCTVCAKRCDHKFYFASSLWQKRVIKM